MQSSAEGFYIQHGCNFVKRKYIGRSCYSNKQHPQIPEACNPKGVFPAYVSSAADLLRFCSICLLYSGI